ncbi:MAG: recombinase RecT [Thermoguttaceae bacterium]|nr:recombinase RecT [Thermoguttaceae bacterium]
MTKNELLAADGVKLAPAGAAGKTAIASGDLATFLDANRAKIAERCAKLIDPAKLTRICVQLVNDDKSGKLRQCTQDSFLAALLDCLSCGLLPTHGRGQLIPYGSEVKFQIGYQGILELAARAGITAKPYLIFEEDDFDWTAGTDETITHKPNFRAKRTPETLMGAYVVATYPDGSKRFEVMTKDEIDSIRDRSPSGKGANGPWKTDYLEMAKKTVIRRASKYWPIKYDFDAAIEGDPEADIADAEFASAPSDLFLLYANRIDRAKNLDELDLIGKEIAEKFDVTTAERKAERDSLRELFADRKAEIEGRS